MILAGGFSIDAQQNGVPLLGENVLVVMERRNPNNV